MSFAVKVTITIDGKSYGENGTKFVTRPSGKVDTAKTRLGAEAIVAACKRSAIAGVTETYEIVEGDWSVNDTVDTYLDRS